MKTDNRFDDIRPYYDSEIPAAMERIAKSEHFPLLASYVYPDKNIDDVRHLLLSFNTTRDFQLEVMRCVNEEIISRTITSFTYSGIERLDPKKRYLFVSNHRDIMLDACLLQYILYKNGHETSEITFGANLMSDQLVIDIGKANKMFRVERGGNMKDFYNSSKRLSEYIRHTITEKGQSVWIAQRNGRTKDGIDKTDVGIVKMFGMSGTEDKVASLAELNIVPVSVSYEWESCDILKALELYASRGGAKYVKKPGEDLNSILTGIMQPKGRVHTHFGKMLTADDLLPYKDLRENEYNKQVCRLLDAEICGNYCLMPNNYIAADLRSGTSAYADKYTKEQKDAFIKYMERLSETEIQKYRMTEIQNFDADVLRNIFLDIYANPVSLENAATKPPRTGRCF